MAKLSIMTAADVIKKLKAGGFLFDRYAKGSHEIWNPNTKKRVTIPNHSGVDLPKGTQRAILWEAGYTPEEFIQL